jgi:hypothetical protein
MERGFPIDEECITPGNGNFDHRAVHKQVFHKLGAFTNEMFRVIEDE